MRSRPAARSSAAGVPRASAASGGPSGGWPAPVSSTSGPTGPGRSRTARLSSGCRSTPPRRSTTCSPPGPRARSPAAVLRRLWRRLRPGRLAGARLRRSHVCPGGDGEGPSATGCPRAAPHRRPSQRQQGRRPRLRARDGPSRAEAVKFARVAEAEAGLEREAAVLDRLARERPGARGHSRASRPASAARRAARQWPRGRSRGRRCSTPDSDELPRDGAPGRTELLIELARASAGDRRSRTTVGEHLDFFAGAFGSLVGESGLASLRAAAEAVAGLPVVCEHRDCSPWNVVLADRRPPGAARLGVGRARRPARPRPRLLPRQLPPSSSTARSRTGRTRESYGRLLDPATAYGAGRRRRDSTRYCEALGLDAESTAAACACSAGSSTAAPTTSTCGSRRRGSPRRRSSRRAPFLGLLLEELERMAGLSPQRRRRSQKRGSASPVAAFQIAARAPSAPWTLTRRSRKGSAPAPLRPFSVVKPSS